MVDQTKDEVAFVQATNKARKFEQDKVNREKWKKRRIDAINRLVSKNQYLHSNYIEEVQSIYNSKATTKRDYKKEKIQNEKINTFNVIRNKLHV